MSDERVSDEALREIVSDPAQVSGESVRVPARTTIAIARELLAARAALEAADEMAEALESEGAECGRQLAGYAVRYRRARGAP